MEKRNDALKVIFTIIGVIVSVGALLAVAYALFKKHFKVTFDCDGDCCDCDCEDCFGDCEEDIEPICCCEDEAEECCCCEEAEA